MKKQIKNFLLSLNLEPQDWNIYYSSKNKIILELDNYDFEYDKMENILSKTLGKPLDISNEKISWYIKDKGLVSFSYENHSLSIISAQKELNLALFAVHSVDENYDTRAKYYNVDENKKEITYQPYESYEKITAKKNLKKFLMKFKLDTWKVKMMKPHFNS